MSLRFKFAIPMTAFAPAAAALAKAAATLPPHEAPARHWPLWLRVLAVIAVLVFVRIVARSMRGGAPRDGADSNRNP